MKCYLLLFLVLLLSAGNAHTQDIHSRIDSSNYSIELSSLLSSDKQIPFWLHANQWGSIPRNGNSGALKVGLQNTWALSSPNKWDANWKFGFQFEGVANLAQKNEVILPQANVSLGYGNFEIMVGRRKQLMGIADSTLGTGAYLVSGNALPVPIVQIGFTKFTSVPFTKGWIAFMGTYSDGRFEKNRPVTQDLKLHQKQLYFRVGPPNGKIKLYGGMTHAVQWGGRTPYYTDSVTNQMPKGLESYWRVVTAKLYLGKIAGTDHEATNRIGNHLGSVDVAMEIDGYETNFLFYRQSVYEDGSLFKLESIADGLNGMRFYKKNSYLAPFEINEGVFEFLYLKNQGGEEWEYDLGVFGRDNYFNHAQVRDGWSYYGKTIGTPFVPPTEDTKAKWPAYGDKAFTSNNRVLVLHAGLSGTFLQAVKWTLKVSYSDNSGVYDQPVQPSAKQISGFLGLQGKVPWLGGSTLFGSFAMDNGDLYPASYGGRIGLRKQGFFQR